MSDNIHALIIDPNKDFCDPNGALYVPGSEKDIERGVKFLRKILHKIDDIHCTIDMHHNLDISHPLYWMNSKGEHPPIQSPPYIITLDDVKNKKWFPTIRGYKDAFGTIDEWTLYYFEQLEKKYGKTQHMIFNPHCLIGSDGVQIVPELFEVLCEWENKYKGFVDYVVKGTNFKCEHFSGLMAEVPDPHDMTTQLNKSLINTLKVADKILMVILEAETHCVRATVMDIINNFSEDEIKKLILFEDTTSRIPGCEQLAEDFRKEAISKGMQITRTTDY